MDEQCLSCGRNVAAGSFLFSARKRAVDQETGHEGFLCQACQAGSAKVTPDQEIPVSGRYAVIDLPGSLPGH
jgi:hypothetical protein